MDEDPIVDEEEIDTNLNNIDDSDIKGISKTYRSVELKRWRPAPTVKENPGKPGEMGKLDVENFKWNRKKARNKLLLLKSSAVKNKG